MGLVLHGFCGGRGFRGGRCSIDTEWKSSAPCQRLSGACAKFARLSRALDPEFEPRACHDTRSPCVHGASGSRDTRVCHRGDGHGRRHHHGLRSVVIPSISKSEASCPSVRAFTNHRAPAFPSEKSRSHAENTQVGPCTAKGPAAMGTTTARVPCAAG